MISCQVSPQLKNGPERSQAKTIDTEKINQKGDPTTELILADITSNFLAKLFFFGLLGRMGIT